MAVWNPKSQLFEWAGPPLTEDPPSGLLDTYRTEKEKTEHETKLISAIKQNLDKLEALREKCNSHWDYEDPVYRFYHQSFKVFHVQETTLELVRAFQELAPDLPMNGWFMAIVKEGTGKTFTDEDNKHWLKANRPIIEAFLHARFFLEMICKYGRELTEPQSRLPSGWAAVLYLFLIR